MIPQGLLLDGVTELHKCTVLLATSLKQREVMLSSNTRWAPICIQWSSIRLCFYDITNLSFLI